ncbi:hypothetical protein N8I77_012860 [Diaporthe amygdali]|uniref:ATP synthase subunit g, mitochondrial n=1 Tax=Phomopsis amygdali TaxID=1214568 RepID=A0AAD9S356_PHOAM|nr:ATP synthase subunit g [Diaporthe amygdali]KAJ0115814.1 ATP synthase subunit g [Diaporthe amygdali]KAK2596984.1 hypothetical protein N8I77_012860 [Diaporthe amygdali]
MSSAVVARPLLRQNLRFAARRFQTTDAASAQAKKAADATKETAQNIQSKAAQGLSRVTSAAGPALAGAANAAKGVTSALGKVGGRTGRFVGFVERQVPFVVYYSRVGLELSKLVFQGQKMQPPSLTTVQSYFNRAVNAVKNPQTLLRSASSTAANAPSPASAVQQIRNLSRAQLVGGGVLLAEVLGFFTVGEMVGRWKLIGYHGETGHGHH